MRHARNHLESWMKGLCRLISQYVFSEQALVALPLWPPCHPRHHWWLWHARHHYSDSVMFRVLNKSGYQARHLAHDVHLSSVCLLTPVTVARLTALKSAQCYTLLCSWPRLPLTTLAILRLKTRPGFCSWPARARLIFDVLRTLSLAAARKQQPIV